MEFEDSIVSKLILLFVMEKMEMPLSESSIIDICTNQNSWLNYMKCKDALFQLLDANFVYVTNTQDNEERYTISMEGQSCLAHFYNKISFELRNQIIDYIKNNRMHFKKSQEYVADYFKNNDGTYSLVMKIRSDNVNYPMFEIKIATSSRQTAIEACKKWRENAHLVYEQVYESLINFDEE
ncbi:MAG: DUF4364 family protein [Clostridia bacterium]|nr:DUF4364 family protein [Clostridia bacterium]